MPTDLYADHVVLPVPGGLEVRPATLRIEGSTLLEVLPTRTAAARDVGGLLAPAFVNAHTHLSMSAFRGIGGIASMRGNVVEDLYFVLESTLTADDVRAFTLMALAESLLAGVGTVWDHYYFAEAVADACRTAGMTAVIAPTLQDLEGPGVPHLDQQLAATVSLATRAQRHEDGIVAALGPHATDTVSARLWKEVATLAERHQLPIHAHAAQSHEETVRAQERHGTTPIGWLRGQGWLDGAPSALLVHALYANEADVRGLPAHTVLGYCPGSQMQYCFPASTNHWREAGRPFVVGTDAGACNDGMNVQQELKLLAGGPLFGVGTSEAFERFWRGGHDAVEPVATRRRALLAAAEQAPEALLSTVLGTPGALHPELKVGVLKPGHRANLVVYDLEHPAFWPGTDLLRALALQDVAPSIRRMMVNGRWLTDDRDHQRGLLRQTWLVDARREANARLARFLR